MDGRTRDLKLPPHDTELEIAVLGACLLEREAFAVANSLIFADVFYWPKHRLVYEAMCGLFDDQQPIDMLTVVGRLRQMKKLDEIGGPGEITVLTKWVVSSAHLEDHCKAILESYMKRRGIELSQNFERECYDRGYDPFDSFNKMDHLLVSTQESVLKGTIRDMNFYTKRVYEEYETVRSTGVLGIPTDIKPIDTIFCGLVQPDLFIIAARPGMGKTALAISMTVNMSVSNRIPGAWFSLEMDGVQLTRRMASQRAGIHHSDIRMGKIPEHKQVAFMEALDEISRSPVYIEDKAAIDIRELRTRAIVLKRKYDIKYIIVDYLQLMDGTSGGNKNREQVVSEISRGCKKLAKELQIPVVALSQLSRAVESRSDKIPQLSDLRESGGIEQDADEVLFLYRPEAYGIVNPVDLGGREYSTMGLCVGVAAKNRHGSLCNFAMEFVGSTMMMRSHSDDTRAIENGPRKTTFHILPPAMDSGPEKEDGVNDWGDHPFS